MKFMCYNPAMEKTSRIEGSSSHQDKVVVIGQFVDGLILSIRGKIREELIENLYQMDVVRSSKGPAKFLDVPGLPGGSLNIRRCTRGKYDLVLENQDIYFEFVAGGAMPP